jgi:hypothetical protein
LLRTAILGIATRLVQPVLQPILFERGPSLLPSSKMRIHCEAAYISSRRTPVSLLLPGDGASVEGGANDHSRRVDRIFVCEFGAAEQIEQSEEASKTSTSDGL